MKSQNTLILIKHALPEINPDTPASTWPLSVPGRKRCQELAKQVHPFQPDFIFTSEEPKASETGQILAENLALTAHPVPGLHEHDRSNVAFTTKETFENNVKNFFDCPDQLVMGNETAHQAQTRFGSAVKHLVAEHPAKNLAIVAHGTVITLLTAKLTGLQPFPLWQRLGLPSFIVFSLPDWQILKIEDTIV